MVLYLLVLLYKIYDIPHYDIHMPYGIFLIQYYLQVVMVYYLRLIKTYILTYIKEYLDYVK